MPKGRVPLFVVLPCAAALAAVHASFPSLSIWACVLTGQLYDPWASERTAHAFEYALASGGVAITFALVGWAKGYRTVALVVIPWVMLAVFLVPLGLRFVRILSDG